MFLKKELRHLGDLARIEFSDSDLEKYGRELDSILDYIQQLKEVDVERIKPTSHVMCLSNVFRQDVVKPSIEIDEVLKHCPDRKDKFFRVPKIIEEIENF
ncbi:MAG: Asp-tRNA(Asn)/Glu-tRNA(Gln) amidotransferase subunit GatC [Candidatus Omnitrophica bacterium]|nr:Asp-tRNA(Asn)/Glu-tRNA(Gln) amidotransferase subunit GatC [Candidatus Omnitrophota bacterium]